MPPPAARACLKVIEADPEVVPKLSVRRRPMRLHLSHRLSYSLGRNIFVLGICIGSFSSIKDGFLLFGRNSSDMCQS